MLQNAREDSPIAQTFERDLGPLARYLANPRPAGHAAMNLETQRLVGCLGIGRNGKVDEFTHASVTQYQDACIKNLCEFKREFAKRGRWPEPASMGCVVFRGGPALSAADRARD